jgi:HD-GYP domain-containing protein (c-di-GMP phosphodiesterase class II)
MHEYSDMKERLEALNEIGIALSSETDLSRLLELIVRETRAFTGADAGSLYLVDRDKNALHFEVAQNDTLGKRADMNLKSFKPYSLPLTKNSIAGYIAITGETLNIADAYNLSPKAGFEFNRDFDERNNYRTKSMLLVPMNDTEGERIGVLQLINSIDGRGRVIPFDSSTESLVSSLASQAAVAIKNAQLIKEIKAIFEALIQYSVSAIDARSSFTAGHSRRVVLYTMGLARALNETRDGPYAAVSFSPGELEALSYAAWLHDIGKIGVREGVLDKRNRLSDAEMEALTSRFEYIKASAIIETQKKKLALQKDTRDKRTQISTLDQELERRLQEIERDLAFVREINTGSFLTEAGLQQLTEIHQRRYVDTNGKERYFLTDFEFENLSVLKGNLTKEQVAEIQSHVVHTENIVNKIPFTRNLKQVPIFAAGHHEMLDGSGYPHHITADKIPLQTRIITVADIYEALVAKDRPYKTSMSSEESLAILRQEADNGRLDKELVRIFVEKRVYAVREDS